MKQRKLMVGAFLLATVLLMAACGKDSKKENKNDTATDTPKMEADVYTNLTEEGLKEEIKGLMQQADVSNVNDFFGWVDDYNKTMDNGYGLRGTWTPLSDQEYTMEKMAAAWDATHPGQADSNGRLTAYLLLQNKITAKDREDYGTYIMMDMDQFETDTMFESIKKDSFKFSAVYDEVDVKDVTSNEEFAKAYPTAWKDRGVSFPDGKVSMISVVTQNPYDELAVIDHTGVALKEDGYILFIEKLAPCQPYQVTRYKTIEALAESLIKERNYVAGDEIYGPAVLENDKVI